MTASYGRAVALAGIASALAVILMGWTLRAAKADDRPAPTRQERAERRAAERTARELQGGAAALCARITAQLQGRGVAMTEAQANALARSRRDVCAQAEVRP